jgi:hypothetical protein
VNIEGKGLHKVAFADKEYDKRMAKRSAKSPTTDSVVDRARAAIDRAEGEKPRSLRPVARPKRDMSQEPTATKVETPKVTTTQLPPARTAAEMRGPAGSPRGPAKGTLENVSGRSTYSVTGFTFDQWRELARKERKDAEQCFQRLLQALNFTSVVVTPVWLKVVWLKVVMLKVA